MASNSEALSDDVSRKLNVLIALSVRQLLGDSDFTKGTLAFDPSANLFHGPPTIEVDALPRDQLVFPENVQFYFQHLDKLGLAGIFQVGNQDALYGGGKQTGVRVRSTYRLTEFGEAFVRACT
jgi:hypothetical protein